jgi:hypothetical protein
MSLSRRSFLHASSLAGGVLLAPRAAGAFVGSDGAGGGDTPPQTGFEQSNGAAWTTHEQEVAFLEAVAAQSSRARLLEIGQTAQGRPLHLFVLGDRTPRDATAAQAAPITLFVCSQHGNEPAGREAGLKLLRDLAFTTDRVLARQLEEQTVLVVPSANPDGRAANKRANSKRVDINRDHLNLTQVESQAIAGVLRDWNPDLVLDLHEYGPSVPVLYDDEVLYLWSRNLNVDAAVRDLARNYCVQYLKPDCERAGFTADEYGLYTVDNKTVRVGGDNVNQLAGDEDEGICRNTMGLRHALGVLVESAVTMDPRNGPGELVDQAAVMRRRVASQTAVVASALRFMREQGDVAKFATDSAPLRKAREGRDQSAPVYFAGADNDPPTPDEIQDPPPYAYLLTAKQADELRDVFALHGITARPSPDGVLVELGQAAEPVIPLLLDVRGKRHAVEGTPVDERG